MYTDIMNINILFLFVKVFVEEEGVTEVMMTLEVSEVNFTCRICEYFSNFFALLPTVLHLLSMHMV